MKKLVKFIKNYQKKVDQETVHLHSSQLKNMNTTIKKTFINTIRDLSCSPFQKKYLEKKLQNNQLKNSTRFDCKK